MCLTKNIEGGRQVHTINNWFQLINVYTFTNFDIEIVKKTEQ